MTVSYTHLDVYKRQPLSEAALGSLDTALAALLGVEAELSADWADSADLRSSRKGAKGRRRNEEKLAFFFFLAPWHLCAFA